MLGREHLCYILEEKLKTIAMKSRKAKEYTLKLNSEFGIPMYKANDIICMRVSLVNESDFVIYAVTDVIYNHEFEILMSYFSEQEIDTYSKAKFEVNDDIFPLKFRMVQVKENQWIGKITAKQLMQLRDAQIVYYNENAQRTLQQIVKGAIVHFRIMINQNAVKGIMASLMDGTYIPNTLTFNMPEDIDYIYDEENCTFIIEKQPSLKLDILDGYHRYLAISRAYNLNRNFDYDMELRFVQFPETKAKQFVWQEDQKTFMGRLDSAAMNQTTIPAKVIERLNTDPKFILAGEVNPNSGIINSSFLNASIKNVFLRNNKKLDKKTEFQKVKQISEKLRDLINDLAELDSDTYTELPWKKKKILAVVLAVKYDLTPRQALEYVHKIITDVNLTVRASDSSYSNIALRGFENYLPDSEKSEE